MTQFLPPNLLTLFAPRDPIPYMPPPCKLPHEKKNVHNYHGIGNIEKYFDYPVKECPPLPVETKIERKERQKREKAEQVAYKLEQEIAMWDPNNTDQECTSDAFKTLFVSRINYYTTENKIRREFELYGPIKKLFMIYERNSRKPRGYCFIEYEHERDMHSAYKNADGKKIDGRRVLVDVERGRTVKGWLPRRLGGGIGGTRRGGPEVNTLYTTVARDEYREREDRDRRRGSRRSRSRSRGRDRERSRRGRSPRTRRSSRSRSRKRSRRSRSRERALARRERRRAMEADIKDVKIKDEPIDDDSLSFIPAEGMVKKELMDDDADYEMDEYGTSEMKPSTYGSTRGYYDEQNGSAAVRYNHDTRQGRY